MVPKTLTVVEVIPLESVNAAAVGAGDDHDSLPPNDDVTALVTNLLVVVDEFEIPSPEKP